MTKSATSVPNTLSQNDESIADPIQIVNIFYNFFNTIAAKTNSKIKFSKKSFSDFFKTTNLDTIFIYPTTKAEISNIISSLNPNKTADAFSIPIKVLKLLKKDISSKLDNILIFQLQLVSFLQILKLQK